ncbi:unnamed protein product [Paramecium octaurelia]|uniref:Uncharacterized protein n=1 Tax=Paramecium octaurelia TaxID=43137 RepID=A0A8S1Y543_PAROT|nr:unnamed protein product [Paramecium octaurelia]
MEIKSLRNKKLGCKGKYSTKQTVDYNDKFMKDSTYINRSINERAKQSAVFLQNSSTYNIKNVRLQQVTFCRLKI